RAPAAPRRPGWSAPGGPAAPRPAGRPPRGRRTPAPATTPRPYRRRGQPRTRRVHTGGRWWWTWAQISAASSSSSALWAWASISRRSRRSAPLTASSDTCWRSSSRARVADASISASISAFWRRPSVTASALAASTIWAPRLCAWSMISLALARAAFSSASAVSCACASARWLLSAAARPSAIFFCRSSIALSSGGHTKVAISQIRPAKASAWAIRVRLMSIVVLCLYSVRPGTSCRGCPCRDRANLQSARRPFLRDRCRLRGQAAHQERVGEGEQQANRDADDERGVDQAGGDEHAHLQHRDQLRLAGGGLEELAGHDGHAQAGAQRRSEEHTSELQSRENLVCR